MATIDWLDWHAAAAPHTQREGLTASHPCENRRSRLQPHPVSLRLRSKLRMQPIPDRSRQRHVTRKMNRRKFEFCCFQLAPLVYTCGLTWRSSRPCFFLAQPHVRTISSVGYQTPDLLRLQNNMLQTLRFTAFVQAWCNRTQHFISIRYRLPQMTLG